MSETPLPFDHDHTGPGCTWCANATDGHSAGLAGAQAAGDLADMAVDVVRRTGQRFTSADITAKLGDWGVPITRPNAMGAALSAAHKAGRITPTGDYVASPIKRQHARPLRVWVAS